MQDFRNLQVWQKAHKLTLDTYAVSANMTHPQHFSLRESVNQGSHFSPCEPGGGLWKDGRSGASAVRPSILGFRQRT